MEVFWSYNHTHRASVDLKERAVVWENPQTGEVRYPPKNDVPIPERYSKVGFQRRELNSLKEIQRFEKEKGVKSEIAWYDKGTGRSFDGDYQPGKVDPQEAVERMKRIK